jgi:hypothetical protein
MTNYLDIFTIVSNLAFLFPLEEAVEEQEWGPAIVYALIVLCSSLYHSCNSLANGCIGLSPDRLRNMDFFTAQLCIPIIALYAIRVWSDHWYAFKEISLALLTVALYFAQAYWGNSFYVQMLVAGLSFGAIFAYWGLYALRRWRKHQRPGAGPVGHYLPKYNWYYFTFGISLSALAVSLYAAEMLDHRLYWATHSCWHLCAAFGQYWLLKIWPRKETRLYEESDKHGHRGRRVALLDQVKEHAPHTYAIPAAALGLRHLPPQTRVTAQIKEVGGEKK